MIRVLWVLFLLLPGMAAAHEMRPAFLDIEARSDTEFSATWKLPARDDMRLGIQPVFPAACRVMDARDAGISSGASLQRWTLDCSGGLGGMTVSFRGLQNTMTDVLVRLRWPDGSVQVQRVTPAQPQLVLKAQPGRLAVAGTYLGLGVEHILLGIDHLLFVLALLLLVEGTRRLVLTITAFTIAHSITLAAAALGLLQVAQAPVEAVIALSILFVAMEIVHARQGRPGLTVRFPWVIAFSFGLLHGLGFAGALREIGLPLNEIPLALLSFNLGVEAGQLLFICFVLVVISAWRRFNAPWPAWAWRIPVYAIGSLAAYWTIERTAQVLMA